MSIKFLKPSGRKKAFSLMEIVLATALFGIFSFGVVSVVISGLRSNQVANEQAIANQYASEGIEAARSIKKRSFSILTNTSGAGLIDQGGLWTFSGSNNVFDKYTRTISVESVYRDVNGNIVSTGGALDPNTKKITATVNWTISGNKQDSIILQSYLSDYSVVTPPTVRTGMLVYSTGGTSSDAYAYRTVDITSGQWSSPINMPDIDPNTSNKALRMVKIYASPASSPRKEKMVISRHSDGSNQFIYAQVYDSTTGIFTGAPTLLATINNNSSLFQQNFDGTYLENGDFMAIYSENSNTPKSRIWNGSTWADPVPMRSIGGIPNWIVARARPGTNEVMAVFFSQNNNTDSQYFNGGAYDTVSWTSHGRHSANAPSNYHQLIDFAWSPNDVTKGAMVYAASDNDRSITAKIWTANGAGSGSWSSAANSAVQSSYYVADLRVVGRPGTNQFLACDEDFSSDPKIYCYDLDFTPTFSTPANNLITGASDSGRQRAYDLSFPDLFGAMGLTLYSDETNIAKLKKYNTTTLIWDNSATTAGTLSGILKTVTLKNDPLSNDIIAIMADGNRNLYTRVWDGEGNQFHSAPAWKTFINQGARGSGESFDDREYWFDFAWDNK